jgi:DNA (cytosine-5)-methyltransferase 1
VKIDFNIADLFCGAGGTSEGAREAAAFLGRRPRVTAVNHWPVAIATHTANHPESRHLCTGIDSINPSDLFGDGELDLLWASPECTHHSVARGGKPINDQSRSTAWCVVRWAADRRPPVILIENVPEFETWGPIGSNGRPLKSKKGEIFKAWCDAIRALGYKVDHRLLCSADYGDPTTRTRLFIQCVRGNRKIVWPEPTHTRHPDLTTSRRWAPARDIIDWSLEGGSIYERKKPLSPKTLARIEAGLRKFGLKDFIVPQQSNPTPKGVDEPLPTIVAEGSGPKLVRPFLVPQFGEREGQQPRTHDIEQPLPAVTSHGAGALVQPFLVPQHSSNGPRSIDKPAPTITTTSRGVGLVQPFIVAWDNQSGGPGGGIGSIEDPISTVVTKARHGVAEPFLVELRGSDPSHIENSASSLADPIGAVTAGGTHHALAQPFLVKTANGVSRGSESSRAKCLDDPMPTICGNRGDVALIQPYLLGQQQGAALRPISEPAPTVATAGAIALVEPYLISFYGNGQPHDIADPAPTVTCKDRFGLVRPVVVIDGNRYLLDIRFRMLQPHELALAMGFPKGYKFTGTKTDQVKQIGNAVTRRLARALVAAVLSQNSDVSALVDAEEREVAA